MNAVELVPLTAVDFIYASYIQKNFESHFMLLPKHNVMDFFNKLIMGK